MDLDGQVLGGSVVVVNGGLIVISDEKVILGVCFLDIGQVPEVLAVVDARYSDCYVLGNTKSGEEPSRKQGPKQYLEHIEVFLQAQAFECFRIVYDFSLVCLVCVSASAVTLCEADLGV